MAFTLAELSRLSGVSGDEGEVMEYLIPVIKEKCDKIEIDSMGNVIAFKRGISDKYRILVGTSVDEVGFIVSDITDSGFVKFKAVGGIDPRNIVSKCVSIGSERIPGVIGMKAIHLQKREEREATVKIKDLFIDIGAADKAEAENKVKLGDRIVFRTEFADKGDIIKGKALNRMTVTALLRAMDEQPRFDTYFVFATQGEVLCSVPGRGMRTAAYRINPDYAFVINTVNTDDFYTSKQPSASLGDGVIVEYMDKSNISNTMFADSLFALAKKHGIKNRAKTSSLGTSVAGAILAAGTGAVTVSAAIPCRYYRTPVSYMNKNDISAMEQLCVAFVKESDVIIDGIVKEIN